MAVLSGFHHVKMPVADVARSRDWYQRVLGFEQELEFVEDGVLMGLAMRDPGGTARLAARHDPARAAALADSIRSLSGFPPGPTSRSGSGGWTSSASRTAGSSRVTPVRCSSACATRTASRYGCTPWTMATGGVHHELDPLGYVLRRGDHCVP
jgi:catechol 2,3-dioxygenase-like lactoylglutathione lyase family enzyme